MKFRKVIESGIITAALAVSSVTTAVSASAAEVDTTGVVGSVLDRASQIASTGIQSVQITHQNAQAAAAAAAQAAEWANKMLVTVDENSSLNIRKEASQDAEVVGKFYHGSGAEVLEVGAEWTKVKSVMWKDMSAMLTACLVKKHEYMQRQIVRHRQQQMRMESAYVNHTAQMQRFWM